MSTGRAGSRGCVNTLPQHLAEREQFEEEFGDELVVGNGKAFDGGEVGIPVDAGKGGSIPGKFLHKILADAGEHDSPELPRDTFTPEV
jgi:hypothetical protein